MTEESGSGNCSGDGGSRCRVAPPGVCLVTLLLGALLVPVWAGKHAAAPRPVPAAAPSYELQAADPGRLPARADQACREPGDDLAPTLVVLPPGRFLMGSAPTETERDGDEGPQHWVTLPRPFAIGRCEVSRAQFRRFVEETGYRTVAEKSGGCRVYDPVRQTWSADPKASWERPGFQQDDGHPAVCVAWEDARACADWLSRRTGAAYRLPSEAEWEYAARGGTVTAYYWGDVAGEICRFANLADSELTRIDRDSRNARCSDGFPYTAPGGSYPPNPFGLYDMAGNVWEWTADCYRDSYDGAPADGTAREAENCGRRVVRGGSWGGNPHYLRSAGRGGSAPDGAGIFLGFRLARAL